MKAMKKLLVVLLFLFASCVFAQGTTPAVASLERTARIESARQSTQDYLDEKGLKDHAVVIDTGKDVDLGAGPGPVVVLKLPALGRVCMLALHPTEDLFATLVCEDREPETEI